MPIDCASSPDQGAAGQRLGALQQRDLLAFAELIDRLVEDDQRQDVGLFERRRAGQHDIRLLEGAADVDARLDARDDPARPDVEQRIHLVDRLAVEADRAVAQDLESPALEVVGARGPC